MIISGCMAKRIDKYSQYVSLLMPMNGENGSTAFTDLKGNSVTVSGGAHLTTTQTKYYKTSGDFTSASDCLFVAQNSKFRFGTGDFTIEAWVYPTAIPDSSQCGQIFGCHSYGIGSTYSFYISGSMKVGFWLQSTSTNYDSVAAIPLNQWSHIAVSRKGSSLVLSVNGVVTVFTISASTSADTSYYANYSIGGDLTGAKSIYTGYIGGIRVTTGAARYLSAFTPLVGVFSV